MKRYTFITPSIFFVFLVAILSYELFYAKPSVLPTALIGERVPHFSVDALNAKQPFSEKDLLGKNQVVLLNFWATWCEACLAEHEMLMKIKQIYHVPIYSLLYKDQVNVAEHFLAKYGNPYDVVGIDDKGDVAIEFGIYGTPETYLIDSEGQLIYRHIGIIDEAVWQDKLYPLIKKYSVAVASQS